MSLYHSFHFFLFWKEVLHLKIRVRQGGHKRHLALFGVRLFKDLIQFYAVLFFLAIIGAFFFLASLSIKLVVFSINIYNLNGPWLCPLMLILSICTDILKLITELGRSKPGTFDGRTVVALIYCQFVYFGGHCLHHILNKILLYLLRYLKRHILNGLLGILLYEIWRTIGLQVEH